jgi:hypothetical protein
LKQIVTYVSTPFRRRLKYRLTVITIKPSQFKLWNRRIFHNTVLRNVTPCTRKYQSSTLKMEANFFALSVNFEKHTRRHIQEGYVLVHLKSRIYFCYSYGYILITTVCNVKTHSVSFTVVTLEVRKEENTCPLVYC